MSYLQRRESVAYKMLILHAQEPIIQSKLIVMNGISSDQIGRQTDFQSLKNFLKFGEEIQFHRLSADQCQILQLATDQAYETHEEGERQKSIVAKKLRALRTNRLAQMCSEWVKSGYIHDLIRIEMEKRWMKTQIKPDPIPQECSKSKPWFSRFSSWIKSKTAKPSLNEIEEDEFLLLNHSTMGEDMKICNENIQKRKKI